MTTVKVHYSRTEQDRQISGSVELDISTDAEWQSAWEGAYRSLTSHIDGSFGRPSESGTAVATTEVSQVEHTIAEPVADGAVHFTGCRVMFNPKESDRSAKKPSVRLRIGNGEQIPGQYIDVKSFDPQMMSELLRFRQGDIVDVRGAWDKPWKTGKKTAEGTDEIQWDVIVEGIERV